ncbi:hypothetical protein GK047_26030 [Paenibacillus sp. SYP-B3998]|uniref:Uncharacterized protein n=1 Tax=Paenibacillus sp. SYP-B3998 TaxID=2678564 RepID=A0A6G4A4H0_9BACL|nr:hypothetical protein [Paenibacillus sp. SYP-B3998]NEW09406.1 hypothetical protein [Paenibacillus sp. SYP-B3998]
MTNQRQRIVGNGGNVPQVFTRSFTGAPQIGNGFNQYPGLGGNPFSDFPQGGGLPVPFEGGGGLFGGGAGNPSGGGLFGGGNAPAAGGGGGGGLLGGLLGGGGGTGSTSSNALSGLNLKQISGFVERMGGIDGIIGTMGKVQKVMSSFQQMAPMMKVLFNSFGKGKVNASDSAIRDALPRKRNRRKKSASSRIKSSRSTSVKRKRR